MLPDWCNGGCAVESCEMSNSQWDRIGGNLPGRQGWVGVTAKDNRNLVNGVLWVLRGGAQWKDLPTQFCNWKSVHKRFTRWGRSGIWQGIFQELLGGATAVIPPKANGKEPWEYDRELYRQRNLMERAFNKLNHWRRIATRYDRRSKYYLSARYPVTSVIRG